MVIGSGIVRHGIYVNSSKDWNKVKDSIIEETKLARQNYIQKNKKTHQELQQIEDERKAQEIKRAILPTKIKQQEDCDFGFCDDDEEEEFVKSDAEANYSEKPNDDYGDENEFADEAEKSQDNDETVSENFQDII